MKDREWCKKVEEELSRLQERVTKLEKQEVNISCSKPNEIALLIEWPEANIGGLHFNAQTTRGVFERGEDGNYYSRDILFLSARDTDAGSGCDLLSEYLESEEVKIAFSEALTESLVGHDDVTVFLPKEKRGDGIKKYNGVTSWYWLKPRYAGSSSSFVRVHGSGAGHHHASSVGGCAPAFCVA